VKIYWFQIKEDNECIKLSNLKVNGNDIMKLGCKGKEVGLILDYLLDSVIEERIDNEKTKLLMLVNYSVIELPIIDYDDD